MRIRPLKGQVLVELLPPEDQTFNGVVIPEIAQEGPCGEKKHPVKGIVVEIGPWRTNKRGYAFVPEFGLGAQVYLTAYSGVKVGKYVNGRLRLVKDSDVLAVVETTP